MFKIFKENKPKTPEKFSNTEKVETDKAIYQIIYLSHDRELDGEVLEGSDGLILEGVDDYTDPEILKKIFRRATQKPNTTKLVDHCFENKKPIYFLDLADPKRKLEQAHDKDLKIIAAEALGGGILSALVINDISKMLSENKEIDRRSFLKGLFTASKGVAAAYLCLPVAGMATSRGIPEEGSIQRDINKTTQDLIEKFHPEIDDLVVTLRNHLIAEKAEYLAQYMHKESGERPKLSILVGPAHHGIKEALIMDIKKRQGYIKESLEKNGFDIDKQSIIAEIKFVGDQATVKFIEDEDLTDIKDKKL